MLAVDRISNEGLRKQNIGFGGNVSLNLNSVGIIEKSDGSNHDQRSPEDV